MFPLEGLLVTSVLNPPTDGEYTVEARILLGVGEGLHDKLLNGARSSLHPIAG